jgi:hypothetical protein
MPNNRAVPLQRRCWATSRWLNPCLYAGISVIVVDGMSAGERAMKLLDMYLSRRDMPRLARRFNVGDAGSTLHKCRRDG